MLFRSPKGERDAGHLGDRLRGGVYATVLTSPSVRARRTAELAGYGAVAKVVDDLAEWDYGAYEGRITSDIQAEQPGWIVFRDGCPGGESVDDIAARADRVVSRLRASNGDVLVFSSGHFLRSLAARWCGLPISHGRFFYLSTAAVNLLGYDHALDEPIIRLWNDTRHVGE